MDNIYERLGVRTIINAAGPTTRLSGALMPEEVAEAMREATQFCVDIAELQANAGQLIAELTGAEAGYVTSGAAAGLMLGTAACVAGLDPGKMNRLPDTKGMKNEVIMPRSHRNFYDHAIRSVGVALVEVGISDRFSAAGVRDTEAWEIADAINERSAAIAYVANSHARPPLPEVTAVGREHGVPVIVDAAGQLPPAANLKRFIEEGADLVCFSGGKAIQGPQGAGILCGRRDLVSSAALQQLDQDVLFELWEPPPSLIDKSTLPGGPQHGVGRPCKVGKEQIVGLMVALKRFVEEGDESRQSAWAEKAEALLKAIEGLPHTTSRMGLNRSVPIVRLTLNETAGVTGIELARELTAGEPSIHVNTSQVYEGALVFNPMCLREGDVEAIGERLREILG